MACGLIGGTHRVIRPSTSSDLTARVPNADWPKDVHHFASPLAYYPTTLRGVLGCNQLIFNSLNILEHWLPLFWPVIILKEGSSFPTVRYSVGPHCFGISAPSLPSRAPVLRHIWNPDQNLESQISFSVFRFYENLSPASAALKLRAYWALIGVLLRLITEDFWGVNATICQNVEICKNL